MNEKVCDTVFSHHVCRLLLLLAHFFEFKLIKSETEEQIFLPSYKVHKRTNTHTHTYMQTHLHMHAQLHIKLPYKIAICKKCLQHQEV